MQVVLANNNPIAYRNGVIRLETKLVLIELAGRKSYIKINIIDLREEDILIGYN